MNKLLLCTIVSGMMVLAFNATSPAQTPFRNGDGSASNPYLIAAAADLAALASLVNAPVANASFADKHYRLASDIDLSGYADWTPIGIGLIRADGRDDRLTFRGVFDGADKNIANLKIMRANRIADSFQGLGLFGVIDGGAVRNLGLDGVSINVDIGRVGGVSGAAIAGSVIEGCYVVGDVNGAGSVGGIVGHADDSSAVVNCYVVGNVSGTDRVGGVAGYVYNGVITDSYAVGNVGGGNGGAAAGHIWNSAINESYVFAPQADAAAEMLAVLPWHLLARVVTDVKNAPPIVAVVNEPADKITVGPNPVGRLSGAVNFLRYGTKLKKGTLLIYNLQGKVAKKIALTDKSAGADGAGGWRQVGLWDLTDRKGQVVSEGTYVVKGTIFTTSGQRERFSIPLWVR